jgi:hypothetical protein
MVEKRRAKEAQKIISEIYSYPDKIAITNLLRRGFPTQLKGGYKI